jgi:hypothetical protein
MKKIIVFFLFNIIYFCTAQNILFNPSFEKYTICPIEYSEIEKSINWTSGVEYGGSSDYLNICMLNIQIADTCFLERIQRYKARTGNAFAGFYTFARANIMNNREAITGKLSSILVSNKCYKISFYVKFCGYWNYAFYHHPNCSINTIGALLTSDSILYPTPGLYNNLFAMHPQLKVKEPLNDSINWKKISGDFISNGTERWITITNFQLDDSLTITIDSSHVNYIIDNYLTSYYLIDDVAVYPCDAPIYTADAGLETCVDIGNSITIGTPRRDEYLYWWYDMQGNILDTTAQITVNPTETTSYILVQKDFKFDETRDSVTVTVGNCPLPDYSNLDFEIYPNPCNGIVNVRFNAKIPEGTVMQLYDMIGQEVAKFPLTSATNIATVNLGNLATSVYHATVVVPDVMKKSVKLVVIY